MLDYGNSSSFSVQVDGPFGNAGSSAKLVNITIPAATWKGAESPYAQVVNVENVSVNSRVDLAPDADQIAMLQDRCIALMAENDAGVVTIYAFGNKPDQDLIMQAVLTEVVA